MKCRLCGCEDNFDSLKVKELEMGFKEEFTYLFCKSCGTLQIESIPTNLSKYYPSDYYSFKSVTKKSFIKEKLKKARDLYGLYSNKLNFLGHFLSILFPLDTQILSMRRIIRSLNAYSKILDVGCGEGAFLKRLANIGFKNLEGVDPFIKHTKTLEYRIKLHKQSIMDLDKKSEYDLIMFHHSFEHLVENPFEVLKKVNIMLKKKGFCLIRMPTTSSFAWEKYGKHWVGIQAPRHIMIYSIRGFEILAEKAGFKIHSISYDSTFLVLLQANNIKNIALNDDNSYFVNPKKSIFTKDEIEQYKKLALSLNKKFRGDMICVILRKN